MNPSVHRFSDLFAQLGLPSDKPSMAQFLARRAPLAHEVALADAPFWSPSQAAFLREEVGADADWAQVVDQLDAALRAPDRVSRSSR